MVVGVPVIRRLGVTTADEVHIPVDRQIHFELLSEDVIHSFFMPALGGKRDVVPGQANQLTLMADSAGLLLRAMR